MDFRIEPSRPDGICVRAEFWVETWEDLPLLMRSLEAADIATKPVTLIDEFLKHAGEITDDADE